MENQNNKELLVQESNMVQYKAEDIKNLIYTIRGKQVMLDSDVAMLYHYETKKINQTVKRNIQRFPESFCFRLKEEELEIMWSQIVTTSKISYWSIIKRFRKEMFCDFKNRRYRLYRKIAKLFQKHLIFCQKLGIINKNIKERRRVGANPTL